MKLEGKVAVITGAATGIGRAAAVLFAKEGAKVVIIDIKDKDGNETVRMIQEAAGGAIFTHADVAVVTELEKAIKMAVDTYGRLDIFFHNAGVPGPSSLEQTSEEVYDRCMTINLKAGLFGAKFAVPELKKAGGGCILFTASSLGLRPSPQTLTYSVSKAGLLMLTGSLARILAKDNIRVNAICPGPVVTTALWTGDALHPGRDAEFIKAAVEHVPLKRSGTPEEMAAAALFLVSPDASYITGVALPVDGGEALM